ncbi:Hypothetical predicted protein [Cloeon dipterum]|uniref:Uncharacterized protein n=1 Tax=Cloeon dipterum TaxID=197152 RepID=A0A8S1D3T1_9INSE|nr:Hypothetical predicted protein [Cloeon dipterum]
MNYCQYCQQYYSYVGYRFHSYCPKYHQINEMAKYAQSSFNSSIPSERNGTGQQFGQQVGQQIIPYQAGYGQINMEGNALQQYNASAYSYPGPSNQHIPTGVRAQNVSVPHDQTKH